MQYSERSDLSLHQVFTWSGRSAAVLDQPPHEPIELTLLLTLTWAGPIINQVARTKIEKWLEHQHDMSQSRIALFTRMLEQEPNNTTVRFGLANELMKAELWNEAVEQLQLYLSLADDQGAAYGKLAQALERLGRGEDAREVYLKGIATATQHGHPGLAQEFELALADML